MNPLGYMGPENYLFNPFHFFGVRQIQEGWTTCSKFEQQLVCFFLFQ